MEISRASNITDVSLEGQCAVQDHTQTLNLRGLFWITWILCITVKFEKIEGAPGFDFLNSLRVKREGLQ